MSEKIKYDPTDMESLLLNKDFENLFPEEKEFVLKHIDNQEEYNSMRAMLLQFSDMDGTNDLEPSSQTLDFLMEEFVTEEKRGFKWWLNSVFAGLFPSDRSWVKQPGFQLAMATCVVVVGFVVVQNSSSTFDNMAEAKVPTQKEVSEAIAKSNKVDEVVIEQQKEERESDMDKGGIADNNEANIYVWNDDNQDGTFKTTEGRADTDISEEVSGDEISIEVAEDMASEVVVNARVYTAADNSVIPDIFEVEEVEKEFDLEIAFKDDSKPVQTNGTSYNFSLNKTESAVPADLSEPVLTKTVTTNGFYADDVQGNASSDKRLFEGVGGVSGRMQVTQSVPVSVNTDLIDLLYTAK